MRKSENLKLNLPEEDDFYNINDFNENSEIIDKKVTEIKNKLPDLEVNTEQIKAELKKQAEELFKKQKEDVDKIISKAIKDIADSKGASKTTFNPDKTITTVNSLETVTTTINKKERTITEKHAYKNGLTKTLKTVFKGKQIITTEEK